MQGVDKEDIVAVMRLDILLFGKLLIPDSHLFDGNILLRFFTPESLAAACGQTADRRTVEIRLRQATFQGSLTEYLLDNETRRLRPLEFRFLISDTQEAALADRLRTGISIGPHASPIPAVLREMDLLGVSKEDQNELKSGWKSWGATESAHGLFTRWPRRAFDLRSVVVDSPLKEDTFATGEGEQAYAKIVDLVARGDSRSASADEILRQEFKHRSDDSAQLDRSVLREWYHDCRQVTISRQHNCLLANRPSNYAHLLPAILNDSQAGNQVVENDKHVDALKRIVSILGGLTEKEYGELLDSTKLARRSWLAARNKGTLERLVEGIMESLNPKKPKIDKPIYQQERVIVPTGTTFASFALSSGSPAAAAAGGLISAGLMYGGAKVSELLTRRGDVRSIVRWALDSEVS